MTLRLSLPAVALAVSLSLSLLADSASSLSAVSERLELSKAMLRQSLLSPSGKLTLSPEIVLPVPKNPTAVLLQRTTVSKLSETIRTKAKANAAFLSGSVESVSIFASEQGDSRGNFPGPVPVIYCDPQGWGSDGGCPDAETLAALAEGGASGVVVRASGSG
eukprot:CAMPEP_0183307102 /NCGR_PEP_ID=MMETSP0160_2-20130417/16175_1 /TAXON_ID=2839 ORGANISM="Odontella Sinensis, Strain Grunow 1884" /NCGR_SAMPLE_ID=MMETSP0160_2 /ASSEMBLY_ACC=CAM_ASM_000250 /LENGTH=161 /DNA_ID=CAMNT_0025470617 /DNA_START=32 /DNA_END=513 /DNA_ORIENTATION=-